MDIINERKQFAQLVKPAEPIEIKLPENEGLTVDFDPNSNFTSGSRLKVVQEDVNLHASCLAGNTSADDKINVTLDNVVCRWVDSNNLHYHQIYPLGFTMYNVNDVSDGINLNSIMGSYKGMIESIVDVGTVFSVTVNYHAVNYSRHVTWLSYGQTWTKTS